MKQSKNSSADNNDNFPHIWKMKKRNYDKKKTE